MLPPGHIAAGYLTGYALLKFVKPDLTPTETQCLLYWSMFLGFAPDLDFFLAFAKEKAWTIKDFEKNNHRKFLSHAPVLWLIAGLLVYFFSHTPFYQTLGLLIWLCSWSHFLGDSVEYGIEWLWPVSNKFFGFKKITAPVLEEKNFFKYWWQFGLLYLKTPTFCLETLIIVSALIVYFR